MPSRRPTIAARKAPVVKRAVAKKAVAKKTLTKVAHSIPRRPRGIQPHHVAAVWEFVAVTGVVIIAGLLALLISF